MEILGQSYGNTTGLVIYCSILLCNKNGLRIFWIKNYFNDLKIKVCIINWNIFRKLSRKLPSSILCERQFSKRQILMKIKFQ